MIYAVLGVVVVIIAVIVYRVCTKAKDERSQDPPISVIETEPVAPPRRRPDLRVEHGDPTLQGTVIDDETTGEASASPLIVGAAQTIGKREDQEDAYGYTEWKRAETLKRKGFMAVMADGIGGLSDGQVASRAAVHGALDMFNMQTSEENPSDRVLEITAAAQRNVLVEGGKVGTDNGCTFLCALVDDLSLCMASVGDSRIALYRAGVLLQLNREHVLGREIDETNVLTGNRRVENAQRRKAITAYLGKRELRTIDRTLRPMQLISGDRVLLMSDGVFNALPDETLAAYLDLEPQAAAEAIIHAVEDRQIQGQDNATIVIVGVR